MTHYAFDRGPRCEHGADPRTCSHTEHFAKCYHGNVAAHCRLGHTMSEEMQYQHLAHMRRLWEEAQQIAQKRPREPVKITVRDVTETVKAPLLLYPGPKEVDVGGIEPPSEEPQR